MKVEMRIYSIPENGGKETLLYSLDVAKIIDEVSLERLKAFFALNKCGCDIVTDRE